MDVIVVTLLGMCLVPQGGPPPAPAPPGARLGVQIDARTGWPVVTEPPARAGAEGVVRPAVPPATAAAPAARSTESALSAVLAAVGPMAAFQALGGVAASWRLTVHGVQGEPLGERTIQHLADLGAGARDRLTFVDGRVYGQSGAMVFAERHRMPWPTLVEMAGHELRLFGLHLRLPWAFADTKAFAAAGAETVERDGQPWTRLCLQRRPDTNGRFGPEPEPVAVDRFELWTPAAGGPPAELVQQLAGSGQERRILLEDWRSVGAVQVPFRRVYLDANGRPLTTLALVAIEPGRTVGDRDFRLP